MRNMATQSSSSPTAFVSSMGPHRNGNIPPPIGFVYSDGGRAAAGFRGRAPGDCVTRAISIATGLPYQTVYDAVNETAKAGEKRGLRSSARSGVIRKTYEAYLATLGWTWTPTMRIGTGCRVHMRSDELPAGRIIARLSGHLAAVVDGVILDLTDCSRGGTRCVYGYFSGPHVTQMLPGASQTDFRSEKVVQMPWTKTKIRKMG